MRKWTSLGVHDRLASGSGREVWQPRFNIGAATARLASAADARRFFACKMSGLSSECLCVAHLDTEGSVLGVSIAYARCANRITVPYRRIASDALRIGACALVMAHNHPSGDPTPSAADHRATARLAEVAEVLGIALHDHLIFAAREWRSFRTLGLL